MDDQREVPRRPTRHSGRGGSASSSESSGPASPEVQAPVWDRVLGGRCSVLLVEDDPGDARLLEELLSGSGRRFDLHVAGTLAVAVDMLVQVQVDVAVADLGLPDATDMQVVETLREVAGQVPVVVLTGRDDPQLGLVALQHGAQDYLVKGQTTADEIERSLRFAIERQRLTHLVTSGVLQSDALSRIEAAGRRIVDLDGFVDQLVDAVGQALPRIGLEVDVESAVGSAHRDPPVPVGPDWEPTSWQLHGAQPHGRLTALAPVGGPLTEHEQSFLGRVADVATSALDAFDAATGKRLRERQLGVLYEASRALVGCVDAGIRRRRAGHDDTRRRLVGRGLAARRVRRPGGGADRRRRHAGRAADRRPRPDTSVDG